MRTVMVAALMLLLSACVSSSYMGIPLAVGKADPAIQELAVRAQGGDKQAQLDLGIRFEEGNGVPANLSRAKSLYRLAASDSGRAAWVYVPSPGNGAKAQVMSIDRGPRKLGLDEAKRRLETLTLSKGEPK